MCHNIRRTTNLKHIVEEVGSKMKAAEFTVVMDENGQNIHLFKYKQSPCVLNTQTFVYFTT